MANLQNCENEFIFIAIKHISFGDQIQLIEVILKYIP